jgi:hypothetical protein
MRGEPMGAPEQSAAGPLATLTHARLRVLQGDLRAARRILTELLARAPGDAGARDLLERLVTLEPLRRARVIAGLRSWIDRVKRNAGDV